METTPDTMHYYLPRFYRSSSKFTSVDLDKFVISFS